MSKPPSHTTVILMAKAPIPGRVKTRLIDALGAHRAADVHAAMTRCTLSRLDRFFPGQNVLALDGEAPEDGPRALRLPPACRVMPQGDGDLGRRIEHVWQQIGSGPAVFFGGDSPDVPDDLLRTIGPKLAETGAIVGPCDDGGYWTIGAVQCRPALLRGIDWGSDRVYHQTLEAARRADIPIAQLPRWTDVDTPDDLDALTRRLQTATDRDLIQLREHLTSIHDAAT